MESFLISFVVTVLVCYIFTGKYAKTEEYVKYVGYTALISLPLSYAVQKFIHLLIN